MKFRSPLFASDVTAARLLDLKTGQFKELVEGGHLPPGQEIAPGILRWDTNDLRRLSRGGDHGGWSGIDW